MDSLSYLSVANFDGAQKEVHATRESTVHDERDQSTAKDEKSEVEYSFMYNLMFA